MAFNPIASTKKKSELVAEQVLSLIRSGALSPGTRLPQERKIAADLGVSRTVVREVLTALQLLGIVETRSGDGTYVLTAGARLTATVTRFLDGVAAGLDVVEVRQARDALDIALAYLVIENAASKLASVEEIIGAMRNAVGAGALRTYTELTRGFHQAVARAAGNRFLEETVNVVTRISAPPAPVHNAAESIAVYEGLLDALRKRDIAALVALMRLTRPLLG